MGKILLCFSNQVCFGQLEKQSIGMPIQMKIAHPFYLPMPIRRSQFRKNVANLLFSVLKLKEFVLQIIQ